MALLRKKRVEKEDALEAEKVAELQARAKARAERLAGTKLTPVRSLDEYDTRRKERVPAGHPAVAISEDDQDVECTIADLSADGFKLTFDPKLYLSQLVIVDSPAFGGALVAEVKWQFKGEAGLLIDRELTRKLSAPTQ